MADSPLTIHHSLFSSRKGKFLKGNFIDKNRKGFEPIAPMLYKSRKLKQPATSAIDEASCLVLPNTNTLINLPHYHLLHHIAVRALPCTVLCCHPKPVFMTCYQTNCYKSGFSYQANRCPAGLSIGNRG